MAKRSNTSRILLAVGFLLIAAPLTSYILLASEFTYVDMWYDIYPAGSSSDPYDISHGKPITLRAVLQYRSDSGFYEDPKSLPVSVDIYKDTSKISTVTLAVAASGNYYATFEGSWDVPSGGGITYRFIWKVATSKGTTTRTAYVKTIVYTYPDGYFKVNEQRTEKTDKVIVVDPSLSFEFVPTKGAEHITAIYIQVWKGGAKIATKTLSKSGTTYKGTYTLPSAGTYRLDGYIDSDNCNDLLRMSFMPSWAGVDGTEDADDDTNGEGVDPSRLRALCLLSGGAGVFCIALGLVWDRMIAT